MNGSDFDALRAFAKVAELGSFVRAAANLGMAPSTLSQIIKALEQRIGTTLLHRTTRRVSLTSTGTMLLARVGPASEAMRQALDEVRNATVAPRGLVRLHIPRPAYEAILAARLGELHKRFPQITLDVAIDDCPTDMTASGYDIDVRRIQFDDPRHPGIVLDRPLHHVVVASPGYLARRGRPDDPADLTDHACIGWRRPGAVRPERWRFKYDDRWVEPAVDGPLIVSHCDAAVTAAIDGVGLAYVLEPLARAAIRQGHLASLLEPFLPRDLGWRLVWADDTRTLTAVKAISHFLTERPGH